MTRENLSTNGNEFSLPNGKRYSGKYHIHVSKGAMVGATHSNRPHDTLSPLNSIVAEKVRSIQTELRAMEQHERKIKGIGQQRRQRTAPSRPVRRNAKQASTRTSNQPSRGGGY